MRHTRGLPGREESGPNSEFKIGLECQGKTLDATWRRATLPVVHRGLGNRKNGPADKAVKDAASEDFKFLSVDINSITVNPKNREVSESRPLLIGIARARSIKGVSGIGASGVGRLAYR